ncbi:MAG: ATP synthase F1 subunit delta [Gemmataceae bacterium]
MATQTKTDMDPTVAPSVFEIDVLQIARVYAQALLRNAQKRDKVDLIQQHFDNLFPAHAQHTQDPKSLANLMTSGAIPRHRRTAVIEDAFKGRVDDLFLDFLQVLNQHDRLDIIRPVGAEYRELRDELYNRVRFQVRTVVPLTDAQREEMLKKARERFQTDAVLVEVIDPDLLGGMQVQVGDRLFDLSLRSRLQAIKKQLIERSSHEIQRRRDRVGS